MADEMSVESLMDELSRRTKSHEVMLAHMRERTIEDIEDNLYEIIQRGEKVSSVSNAYPIKLSEEAIKKLKKEVQGIKTNTHNKPTQKEEK